MTEITGEKYPIIRKGRSGFWYAYGKGWAVYASTREAVKQKYNDMLELINELISRPIVKTIDI